MPKKSLVLRSYTDFVKAIDLVIAGHPVERRAPLLHTVADLNAAAGFQIAAVITCRPVISVNLTNEVNKSNWLTANCQKRWYVQYNLSGSYIRRIAFEDEGDAFRFAWAHENLTS